MPALKLEYTHGLPEKWTPLEVVSVVKCLDEEGDVALTVRESHGLAEWEVIGMLQVAQDAVRGSMQADFHEKRNDDEV